MNLLIVEDNEKMRRMIRSIVADLADRIDECADGIEALSLYTAHLPDYVLMDIQMKNMNGIAATRQICERFQNARIIIVTNYNDPAFRKSARDAGAFGYVLKENLLEVRRILEE
jgi:CheY-like chemotaxis protein